MNALVQEVRNYIESEEFICEVFTELKETDSPRLTLSLYKRLDIGEVFCHISTISTLEIIFSSKIYQNEKYLSVRTQDFLDDLVQVLKKNDITYNKINEEEYDNRTPGQTSAATIVISHLQFELNKE